MNIIEKMQEVIRMFPELPAIAELHTDIAESEPDSYSLASTGDTVISEDIIGNPTRRHSFLFSCVWSSASDFERLRNSGVLLSFAMWICKHAERQAVTADIDGTVYNGIIDAVETDNGMLLSIPDEINGGVQYQLQIFADYKINMEV